MFLYQTHQRSKRQKYHLQQNSLQLQTAQDGKRTSPVDRGRQQTRLLWRRRHFHGRHNNIQDPNYVGAILCLKSVTRELNLPP
jgi:hypothetical protein